MTRHDPERGDHVLAVIEDYAIGHGYAPSVREIARRVGLASTAAVAYHIDRLIREGRLTRTSRAARSLRVVRSTEDVCAQCGRAFDL